jgi:beta-lactamase class D
MNALDTSKGTSWYLGYVEENKHPYFFVLYTKSIQSKNSLDQQALLLKNILRQQGFLKGLR